MGKYTINQFRERYPNDDACLDKIFELRFTNLICPKCEGCKPFARVKNRRSYQCPDCCYQIYPTKDTVFEKTTTPLSSWFYIIYLQTVTRNGVSAKEIERQLSVCYKTALRMAHQIKKLMADKDMTPLAGICEIDEAYIGGHAKNKHKRIRAERKANKTSPTEDKIAVIGMLSRGQGIKAQVIPANKHLKQIVRENVHPSASIVTDSFSSYEGLDIEYFKHEIVNHLKNEFVRDGIWHTNSIEGFWSLLKRTISGTHIHVSPQHLQKYIDEVLFRYQHRDNQEEMFEIALLKIVA